MLLSRNALATVFYVDLNSTNPTPPYANWTTAATNIQDAVDAAGNGDLVLVTNGIYQTGGYPVDSFVLTNRVAVTVKPITVQSVNGPAVTVIEGYQVPGTILDDSSARCVYLTNGAALIGFTLTNSATRASNDEDQREESGGGIWCESGDANRVKLGVIVWLRCHCRRRGGIWNVEQLHTFGKHRRVRRRRGFGHLEQLHAHREFGLLLWLRLRRRRERRDAEQLCALRQYG